MTLKFSLEHAVIHQGKAADFFKAERKSRACFNAEPFVFFRFDDIACAVGQHGGSVLIAAGKVVRNGGFQFGNERSGGVCPQSIAFRQPESADGGCGDAGFGFQFRAQSVGVSFLMRVDDA